MKFIVEVPDDKMPALRQIGAELLDENEEDIDDVEIINELFYINTGYMGSDLDLRKDVTVELYFDGSKDWRPKENGTKKR